MLEEVADGYFSHGCFLDCMYSLDGWTRYSQISVLSFLDDLFLHSGKYKSFFFFAPRQITFLLYFMLL